ncbi:MAG: hypothetical protein Q9228_001476 [Teloschistes exilis]
MSQATQPLVEFFERRQQECKELRRHFHDNFASVANDFLSFWGVIALISYSLCRRA